MDDLKMRGQQCQGTVVEGKDFYRPLILNL